MAKCTCQPLREARHLQGCELDYRSGFWGCPCPALLVHCPGSVFETDLQSNLNFFPLVLLALPFFFFPFFSLPLPPLHSSLYLSPPLFLPRCRRECV